MAKKVDTGFAAKLRALREAAGLTQAQLAERSGMNQFGVAKLEQGLREPSWASVMTLANALGVSCEAFAESFTETPPVEEPRSPGRPRKPQPEAPPPKKGRGKK